MFEGVEGLLPGLDRLIDAAEVGEGLHGGEQDAGGLYRLAFRARKRSGLVANGQGRVELAGMGVGHGEEATHADALGDGALAVDLGQQGRSCPEGGGWIRKHLLLEAGNGPVEAVGGRRIRHMSMSWKTMVASSMVTAAVHPPDGRVREK